MGPLGTPVIQEPQGGALSARVHSTRPGPPVVCVRDAIRLVAARTLRQSEAAARHDGHVTASGAA